MPRPGKRKATPYEKMGEQRAAWLHAAFMELVLYLGDKEDDDTPIGVEGAETTRLSIRPRGRSAPTWITLTNFTTEELDAFQNFVNVACDIARPSCQLLDKEATRRYEEDDDDSFARIYRAAPELVVREGKVQQHSAGIQGRFDGAVTKPTGRARLPRPGDADGGVPDPQQADLGGSNNGEEASSV